MISIFSGVVFSYRDDWGRVRDDSVSVNIVHVEMPQGGTGKKCQEINLDKYLTNKRSIVCIQNTDNMCLARALVVAIAKRMSCMRDVVFLLQSVV